MTAHLALALTLSVLSQMLQATTLFIGDTGLFMLGQRLFGALDSRVTDLATFEAADGRAVELVVTKLAASVTLAAGSRLGLLVVAVVSVVLVAATQATHLGLI